MNKKLTKLNHIIVSEDTIQTTPSKMLNTKDGHVCTLYNKAIPCCYFAFHATHNFLGWS